MSAVTSTANGRCKGHRSSGAAGTTLYHRSPQPYRWWSSSVAATVSLSGVVQSGSRRPCEDETGRGRSHQEEPEPHSSGLELVTETVGLAITVTGTRTNWEALQLSVTVGV